MNEKSPQGNVPETYLVQKNGLPARPFRADGQRGR